MYKHDCQEKIQLISEYQYFSRENAVLFFLNKITNEHLYKLIIIFHDKRKYQYTTQQIFIDSMRGFMINKL